MFSRVGRLQSVWTGVCWRGVVCAFDEVYVGDVPCCVCVLESFDSLDKPNVCRSVLLLSPQGLKSCPGFAKILQNMKSRT